MKYGSKKGFTLVEMMMALVVSVVVFSAMGVLLTKCFSLWMDSSAHWKLAQHARITRVRILSGAFDAGSGVLSSTNLTIESSGVWNLIQFYPVSKENRQEIWGSSSAAEENVWMRSYDPDDSHKLAWAQSVSFYGISDEPLVTVNQFDASYSNQLLTLDYTLNLQVMGKTFEKPQTIEAYLVND